MRASEFIVKEGIGDWMQGQVIGREQKDKAKAQKQNTPKIANLLSQNLIAVASQIDNPSQKKKKITDMMSKVLKVNVTRNRETFDDSVDKVISAISSNANPANITSLVQDVVKRSFTIKDTETSTAEDIASWVTKVVKSRRNGQAQFDDIFSKALANANYNNEEIKELIVAYENENAIIKDMYKSIVTVLDNDTMPSVSGAEEPEPEADSEMDFPPIQGQGAEPEAEPEPEAEVDPNQKIGRVYFPDGQFDPEAGDQYVFVRNNRNGYSLMQMISATEWAMLDKVEEKKTQQDMLRTIKKQGLSPVKLGFSLNQNNNWNVSNLPEQDK